MKTAPVYLLLLLLAALTDCSSHRPLSRYYATTHYVSDFNTYIINDSLKLSIRTPADIDYKTDRAELLHKLNLQKTGHEIENLLAYGETTVAPHYKIYFMLDPAHAPKANGPNEMVRDTVLDRHRLVMLCRSAGGYNPPLTYRTDCRRIFASLNTGPRYREGVTSLSEFSRRYGIHYYEGLERILDYPAQGRNEKWIRLQMALNYASFLAPNPTYLDLLQKFERGKPADSIRYVIRDRAIQGKKDVYSKMLEEAGSHRLVLFNENHFFPNHRRLLTELLDDFKKIGFDYLALEALGEGQDSLLNAGASLTLESGFYPREPRFAALIRKAQQLGYTFVSYEAIHTPKGRDYAQAEKLYSKTIGRDDSARVLVLAGLDHILERPTSKGRRRMAALLHSRYHLDPLTISQSHLNRYRQQARPVALIWGNVFHRHRLNSVDWLLLNNLPLTDTHPNFSFINRHDQPVQVSLFFVQDSAEKFGFRNRIPYRAGLVQPGETVQYHLSSREYREVVFDERGEILENRQVSGCSQ